jgi:hypothetical protein
MKTKPLTLDQIESRKEKAVRFTDVLELWGRRCGQRALRLNRSTDRLFPVSRQPAMGRK